jgi:thioredoxin-related protein
MSSTRFYLLSFLMVAVLAPVAPGASSTRFKWITNYDLASSLARKQDKIILAYFSGSDWEPWTQKLDEDVLSTDRFKVWAQEHVIPLQLDFPRDKHPSAIVKQQNEKLKLRYSISKVPTFVFLDPTGQPIARASYEDVCLRPEEVKGQPRAAIAFLDGVLKNRPKDEQLKQQPNLPEATAFAKKHYAVMLVMITQGHAEYWIKQRDALLKDQDFVRFVNRNVVFVQLDWPEETDLSPQARAFRAWAEKEKIVASPFQLVIWDVPFDKVKARIHSFNLNHIDGLIKKIEIQLPRVDYTGSWITDYNLARTIAAQHDRYMFLAFTSMDGGDWSKKMDEEIFKSDRFKTYAHKNLVLVKLDFPTAATQPEPISTQNKMLADLFNIRGFPTVIVLNPLGQKLFDSKYIKGGADLFMTQMERLIQHDMDRLAKLKEED